MAVTMNLQADLFWFIIQYCSGMKSKYFAIIVMLIDF